MGLRLGILLVLLSISSPSLAQAGLPVYDVYSVRLNKGETDSVSLRASGDAFVISNTTVSDLLQTYYHLPRIKLISQLPNWATTKPFDIRAKISDYDPTRMSSLTADQRLEMQRRLLTTVFKLSMHREAKILPVYEMVIAAHGLKMFKDDLDPTTTEGMQRGVGDTKMNESWLSMKGYTTADLADRLSFVLDRDVIDKTGLTGKYDVDLHWSPSNGDAESSVEYPKFFEAIQQQIGLKLIPARAVVETWVIDHIEMPDRD